MQIPTTQTLRLDDIKPYWRNPRRIPEEAVVAVAESIKLYGYQQPIVVDTEHVIIVGHTRHLALQRLGYTEVQVYVSDLPPDKAREYRLVDNRTGEMTSWDFDALVMELREFEEGLLTSFFPEIDLEIGQVTGAVSNVADATETVTRVAEASPEATHTTEVVCPSCLHVFSVRTKSLPGLTYEDMNQLAYADGEAQ